MDDATLLDQGIKKREGKLKTTWEQLNHDLGSPFPNGEAYSNWVKRRVRKEVIPETKETPIGHKDDIHLLADDSHKNDKLIEMSEEQRKDKKFLLLAHGYDPREWGVVDAKSSMWGQQKKDEGIITLYASKLTVKPIYNRLDYDKLIELIKNVKPVVTNKNKSAPLAETDYINIPLFDMHFGNAKYEDYKHTQAKIQGRLSKRYKDVLFIVGQDLLHNDNFKGETSKGTPIDKVDMVQAWSDALTFYEPLVKLAIENSDKVKIIYSKGNHDESMSWAFVQMLKGRFPGAMYDDSFTERKVHMLGLNFIGINHGEKVKEDNLPMNFANEFPIQWSQSTTKTVHTGHRHIERVVDKDGVLIRRMPTRNPIDTYHDNYGYTMGHKRFEIFEYSETEVEAIYYV